MPNVFTLEDLESAIEREYAPLTFKIGEDEFVLQSLLRVDKKIREAVIDRLNALDKTGEVGPDGKTIESSEPSEDDTLAAVQFVLKSVTKGPGGPKLVRLLGNDLIRNMTLMRKWSEATRPGEATDSPA